MKDTIITEEWRLREIVDALLHRDAFAFDVETDDEHRGVPAFNNVSWLGMAAHGLGCAIPMGHPLGIRQIGRHQEPRTDKNGTVKQFWTPDWEDPPPQIKQHVVFEMLEPVFLSESIIKVADDITFDIPSISKYYPRVPPPPYDDPKVTDQLLNENLRQYGLKERTKDLLGLDYDKHNYGRRIETWPLYVAGRYSYMDAVGTWLRWVWGIPQIAVQGLTGPHEIEKLLMTPLIHMRLEGAPINEERLLGMRTELGARQVDEEARIYQAAGARFNINSNPQKQQILFSEGPVVIQDKTHKTEIHVEGQGLRGFKLTKGGKNRKKARLPLDYSCYSLEDSVLEEMAGNPLIDALREYGDTHKLLSTYVDSWLGTDGSDGRKAKERRIVEGRIYTNFKQYGTVTGRLSSAQPNLQNIPRASSHDGKLLRGIFEAPPGYMLVTADYGQIELVILAHLIGYGPLFDGFLKGIDPHTVRAAGVLDRQPHFGEGGITKDERQKLGKTLGFTIVNGAQAPKVAQMIGGTLAEAKRMLKRDEQAFPEIYEFKEAVFELARSREPEPYVRTLMGRKRRVVDLIDGREWVRAAAERQIFNTLIQGGAADLIKLALIAAHDMFRDQMPDVKLILTVHDEIVALAPEDQAQDAEKLLVYAMTGPHIQKYVKVPISVESAVTRNWADAK